MNGLSWWRRNGALLIVVLAHTLCALAYSVLIPMWEMPDEPAHFDYVRYLVINHSLPDQRDNLVESSHHPPLYYALAAIVTSPVNWNDHSGELRLNPRFTWAGGVGDQQNVQQHSGAETFPYAGYALILHLMRLLSVLLSAGTVWLTALIGDELFPNRHGVGLLAAVLVGLNPQFVFISAAAMNDNLLVLAATACLLLTLRAVRIPFSSDPGWFRAWAILGVWLAVAAMSKISGVVFVLLGAVALFVQSIRLRSWRAMLSGSVSMALPFGLLAGWWFVRNQVLYKDLLGNAPWEARFSQALASTPPPIPGVLREQFLTFWARFGWMNVGLPIGFYDAVAVICILGLVGLVVGWLRTKGRLASQQADHWFGLGICAALVLGQEALLIRENFRWTTAVQGRYLFPIIAPAMLLVSAGLNQLLSTRTVKALVPLFVAIGMTGLVWLNSVVIAPAYPVRSRAKSDLWWAKNKTQVDFANVIGLRGYDILPANWPDALTVRLYWVATHKPALNYSAFVHLLPTAAGLDGAAVAQQDQSPGGQLGFETSEWIAGDVVIEDRVIALKSPPSAGSYALRIGLYDAASGARLPISSGGSQSPDFVFAPITLPPG